MLDEIRIPQLDFNSFFSRQTLDRAMASAEDGRAGVDGVKPDTGRLRIVGNCRAGRNRLFRQDIQLMHDGSRVKTVAGICSCAEGYNCQHVAAVLLTWRNGGLFRCEDHDIADDQTASPEALAWLQTIEHPEAAPPKPGSQHILYVLSTADFRLALYKARLNKSDAAYGRPEPLRPDLHGLTWGNMPSFFQPEDMPILRLFLALQENVMFSYESSLTLCGEEGARLLGMALRTGRLHLEDINGPVLRTGAALDGRLAWQRDPQGHQQLRIASEAGGGLRLSPTLPPWYVDAARAEVGPIRLDLPEEIAFRLLAAPPLDESDALLVRQRLDEIAKTRHLALPLPEAATPESPEGRPRAILRLESARFSSALPSGNGAGYPQAVATLWFEYPGLPRVAGSERMPSLLHTERDGRALTLLRDRDSETAAWRLLQAHGLKNHRKRLGAKVRRLDAATECLLPELHDLSGWLAFLDLTVPELKAAGMGVEIGEDFPYQSSEAEDWFVEVIDDEFISGSDWFDLDLGVVIGGTRISLVEPLARLISARPQLLEEVRLLPPDEHVPLPLDERHVLPVPVERLRAWLGPLLEFSGEHEHLRLSRINAAVLNDLEKLPGRWLGGERLRELGQRLRDFSGIAEAPPAPGFKAMLRPYQQHGLDWLQFLRSYGFGGVLADDMGLGKTIQALAHLHLEKTSGRADLPSLVVMPTSLIANWCSEAHAFAPDLRILPLHGPERASRFAAMKDADVIFTTYPLLVRDREILLAQEYHLLVLDEAQFIKNPKAQSHRVARQMKARHRLSLTGTPLENHLGELWAQYNFLLPGLLGDVRRFATAFRAPIEKCGDVGRSRLLAERVRPFLLRRTKEQVLTELPPKTEITRWVELSGAQRDLYESLRLAFDKKLRQVLHSRGVAQSQIMILDALLKLRQACCDPRLVKLHGAPATREGAGSVESAKFDLLFEMLVELLDEKRHILLFSQFTSMLGLIEEELDRRGIAYVKLTGQTKDRETPIRRFQNGEVPLFLISLKAGGAGLNLTAADSVIHYDPWWNPAVEEQASARAYRIGQDKPVFVYKLLAQGTVEEKILALQERKRGLADALLAGDGVGGHLITAEDLDVLFQPLEAE